MADEKFEDRILLQIRREFSKNEKYRLFLCHLDHLERDLALERKKNTNLLKEREPLRDELLDLKTHIKDLQFKVIELEGELFTYTSKDLLPNFVKAKTHSKLLQTKGALERSFWEKHAECETLKRELEKLKQQYNV